MYAEGHKPTLPVIIARCVRGNSGSRDMNLKKIIAIGAIPASTLVAAAPANAVIATFAQFSAVGSAANVRWVNNGVVKTSAVNNTTTGTGGFLYTTSTATGRAPVNVAVNFEFLQSQLASVGMIGANFFMDITVASGNAASASGVFRIQNIPTGAFSFTSTQAFSVNNVTYAIGTNLLTGTFSNGTIFGSNSSGSFSGNSGDGTLIYTSDVLDFTNTVDRDYSMGFTSITPTIFRSTSGGNKALRTFRTLATGSFSSDPAPLVIAVPEPGSWLLMIAGFGMVGVAARRRTRQTSVAA
jgi:hypothetical protein